MSASVARLLAIAWIASLGVAPQALANEATDRAAIEAAAQAWTKAFNARDERALLALATDDLMVLDASTPPVIGARAHEAWKMAVLGPVKSTSKEIVIDGNVAWRVAVFDKSQALEIWKRVGGEWKLHRQMSSNLLTRSNLLPPPLEPMRDQPMN
jgi:ketosteroid isomerase-like protein